MIMPRAFVSRLFYSLVSKIAVVLLFEGLILSAETLILTI